MKNKALLRLEKDVDRMVVQLRTAARLQKKLTRALDRNEAELEQLRGEVKRYRTERSDVRRTVDALIKRFERKTGCPVIINTSFNVRGEPIVRSPEEAYRCFLATNMDVLVLEDAVLLKEDQNAAREADVRDYLSQFQLD